MSAPLATCGQWDSLGQLLRLATGLDGDGNVTLNAIVEQAPVTSAITCDYVALTAIINRMFYQQDGRTYLRLLEGI